MNRPNRLICCWLLVAIGALAHAAPTAGAGMKAQFFPLTGEVRLYNSDFTPVDFVFYSITSTTGALNGGSGVWKSIAGNYDASGNGLIDPNNQWTKLSATPNELAESVFTGAGGRLTGLRAISLGNIWNRQPSSISGITVQMANPNDEVINVEILRGLDGDYNGDERVDHSDYTLLRQWHGSNVYLFADGNLNGTIDAADYTIWRDNLGKSVDGSAFGQMVELGAASLVGGAVPEPSTAAAVGMALLGVAGIARRRRW